MKKSLNQTGQATKLRELFPQRVEDMMPSLQGFSHGDCEQRQPLFGAIASGFGAIEADVWMKDGALLVSHSLAGLEDRVTLEDAYLRPLQEHVQAMGGRVYPQSAQSVQLLIDVKTESESTYKEIHALLEKYRAMLTVFKNGEAQEGAVTVVMSGNRAHDTMLAQATRYAAYDGRLPDLMKGYDSSFMPVVSDRWGDFFEWKGIGLMPAAERAKLRELVQVAHNNGQRIRFWDLPGNKFGPTRWGVWKELIEAGVDYIPTKHLAEFRAFSTSANIVRDFLQAPWFGKKKGAPPRGFKVEPHGRRRKLVETFENVIRDSERGTRVLFGAHGAISKLRRSRRGPERV